MPAPLGTNPYLANWLNDLESRIGTLENPQAPGLVFACLHADLPSAATYFNCVARVTDTNILVASDGTNWIRQDTGAPI